MIGLCNLIPQEGIANLSLARGYMQALLPRTKYLFCVEFVESKQLVSLSLFLDPECSARVCRSARAELIAMLDQAWPSAMDRFGVTKSMVVPCTSKTLLDKVDWLVCDMVDLKPGWEESGILQSEEGWDMWAQARRVWGQNMEYVEVAPGELVSASDGLSELTLPMGHGTIVEMCRLDTAPEKEALCQKQRRLKQGCTPAVEDGGNLVLAESCQQPVANLDVESLTLMLYDHKSKAEEVLKWSTIEVQAWFDDTFTCAGQYAESLKVQLQDYDGAVLLKLDTSKLEVSWMKNLHRKSFQRELLALQES